MSRSRTTLGGHKGPVVPFLPQQLAWSRALERRVATTFVNKDRGRDLPRFFEAAQWEGGKKMTEENSMVG